MMGSAQKTSARAALGIFAALLLLATSASGAFALSESPAPASSPGAAPAPSSAAPSSPPATKIVPSDESEGPAAAPSEAGAAGTPSATTKKPRTHHKAVAAAPPEVEPAAARLRVTQDGWIYAAPSKTSKQLEKATIGKFVDVTGSTRYYLQAKLKNGQTGYISPSNVELVKPTDKIFLLSQDAAVLDAPNRWSRKLAQVHRGHNVHVIGIALNYLRVRMKSGLTGFISLTAVQ
jgi:hypothetical protein